MDKILYEKVNCSLPSGLHTIFTNIVHIHPHWHDEIEIVFVCGGSLFVNIQGAQKLIQKGEIAIVSPGEIHSINSCNDDADNIVFMLQITNQFIKNLGLGPEIIRFISFPSGNGNAEIQYLNEIRKLLLLIINELVKMENVYISMIQSHCSYILSLLLRYFSRNGVDPDRRDQFPVSDQGQLRLKRVFEYINENYQNNPALEEIANIACLSPTYFSRYFNSITRMSYSQYLNTVKISMIQQDLLDSGENVVDIMLRHGFSNTKTFNRVFKNYTGYSPSAYRKYMMSFHYEKKLPERTGINKENKYSGEIIPDPRLGSYVNFKNTIEIPDDLFHEYLLEEKNYTEPGLSHNDPATALFISISEMTNKRNIIVDILEPCAKLDQYFCFMSSVGRAGDLLRANIQKQVQTVQKEIGFRYLRFHDILNDEIGIFTTGSKVYNFTYLDTIFDFLKEVNLKPFLEISYMPGGLASGDKRKFLYNANVSIPRDWGEWRNLITAMMDHLIRRYSKKEVEDWYFEVWNEPNFPSDWTGSFDEYMMFYKLTVNAIKAGCTKSKVGGPALSGLQADGSSLFLKKFLEACGTGKLPLDFISAHPYPSIYKYNGDELQETFDHPLHTRDDILWLRETLKMSQYPEAELQLNEWNSSPNEQDLIHDTAFMAPFIIKNYLACQGLTASLGYWALSDLFEERRLPRNEFHGGFGLMNKSGLKKPQYYAFVVLKRLGPDIIAQGEDYIITLKPGILAGKPESIQILVWNYIHYTEHFANGDKTGLDFYHRYGVFEKGENKTYNIKIPNPSTSSCIVEKIVFDREHGSVFDFWLKNGALEYAPPGYIDFLCRQCSPSQNFSVLKPEKMITLETAIPPFGFVFYEIKFS